MRSQKSPLTPMARRLRADATDAERLLWSGLRNRQLLGLKFRRQVAVGRYVADFLCADCALIVELDGGQHADSPSDAARTRFLEGSGYRVLRFWNNQVLLETDAVLEAIAQEARPSP